MSKQTKRFYEFGRFRIDTVNRRLFEDGKAVPLKQKAVETLLVLVENRGEVLEKDALIERLWPDSFVEEANLTQNIYMLRKALGASDYIETVPRRGYRFTAEVREWEEGAADLVVKERTRSSIIIEEEIKEQAETQLEVPRATSAATNPARRRVVAVALASLALLIAALSAYVYLSARSRAGRTSASGGAKSIAVLPFRSLSADDGDDYLGLGMADTLITRLSRTGRALVRPTSAVRRFGKIDDDPVKAGRDLGVDFVLDGSVQRVENRVRVTARLVRTSDGQPLWANQFDEPFTDILKVEDAISEKLASALTLSLSSSEQERLVRRETTSPEAYQLYLKGRYFWDKRTEEGLKRSIEFFQQAIALDPAYALAYSGLADAYAQLPGYGPTASMEVYPKAKAAAAKALELDSDLAEAHTSAATIFSYFEWDWAGAEDEYRKAIALNPNYAMTHHRLGVHLAAMSRADEAVSELRRAQELDPLSLIINSLLGFAYLQAHQVDEAIEQLRKTIEMDRNFPPAHEILAHVYADKGMAVEAFAEFLEARRLSGESEERLAAYQRAFAGSELKGFYRQRLNFLLAPSTQARVQPTTIASLYAMLGEKEAALNWLEKAVEQHEGEVIWIKARSDYDGLRSEARFANLLKRVNLDR
jgi:DNA-binding winged helix-turn-helix (wHTH) protein/TolB-like protein/Flp pilus assembly protein TadD